MSKNNQKSVFELVKNLKPNQLLYVLLLVLMFFVGYLFSKVQYLEQKNTPTQLGNNVAPQVPQAAQPTPGKVNVGTGDFPPLGNKDAKVTIVEFADFQCPFCEKLYSDALASIKKDYVDTGKAKLYYRNWAFLGQESVWAAEASECANEQGKFWEFHDYLFNHQGGENQGAFSKENLKGFAASLGLDTQQFSSCLDSDKYKNAVEKDLSDGKAAGVSGTPATFINGNVLVGAQPYSAFKDLIDKELNK